jgi:hypothetical protein
MWYMTRIRDDTFEVSNEIGQHFVLLKSTNSPGKKKKKRWTNSMPASMDNTNQNGF